MWHTSKYSQQIVKLLYTESLAPTLQRSAVSNSRHQYTITTAFDRAHPSQLQTTNQPKHASQVGGWVGGDAGWPPSPPYGGFLCQTWSLTVKRYQRTYRIQELVPTGELLFCAWGSKSPYLIPVQYSTQLEKLIEIRQQVLIYLAYKLQAFTGKHTHMHIHTCTKYTQKQQWLHNLLRCRGWN